MMSNRQKAANRAVHALVLAIALGLTGVSTAAAQTYGDGLVAYQRGNFSTAAQIFRPLAELGHADAQFNLGHMYANGLGVTQDYVEAVRWWRRAAEQDYAEAQAALGYMYEVGLGVTQDYAEAVRWWRRADEGDLAEAQAALGYMYEVDLDVAQYALGLTYETGWGVPRDFVVAHMWFNLAASQGHADAKEKRDALMEVMTPAQIAEAQRLAREWRRK